MAYSALATSRTPALIVYLLDVSGSMSVEDVTLSNGATASRLKVVHEALEQVAVRMVSLSTRGTSIQPRYRIAMFAYSSVVHDVLGGVQTVTDFAQRGIPQMTPMDTTNTEAAFLEAERLLEDEIPNLPEGSPAPLVCHMTDGETNLGGDPSEVAERIKAMEVPDGNVLIENIYVGPSTSLVRNPATDVKSWSGLSSPAELVTDHAKRLFHMSSVLPTSYLSLMKEMGYGGLQDGVRMMFAGNDKEMIEMAFVMSGVTPTK